MTRITSILSTVVIISFMAATFSLFMIELSGDYKRPYGDTNFSLEAYNKINSIKPVIDDSQRQVEGASETPGSLAGLDIFGGLTSRLWNAAKYIGQSFSYIDDMAVEGARQAGFLGSSVALFVDVLLLLAIIGIMSALIYLILKVRS